MVIKTASALKYAVESAGHESHFFTRKTMKFFGDTMKNYAVLGPYPLQTNMGDQVPVYELARRKPVKHGLKGSAYFDARTFKQVFKSRD